MEIESFLLTELSLSEKKILNGGAFPQLIIALFMPSIERVIGLYDGIREGFERTTQEL